MSKTPRQSQFPHPEPRGKLGTKATTRNNITRVEDLDLREVATKAQHELPSPSEECRPWPTWRLLMEPNVFSRSALFGCAERKVMVGMAYPERVLPSASNYTVMYRGPDLDQKDSEVWQAILTYCRASGLPIGAKVTFAFNDLCRVLDRSVSSGPVNDAIMDSLNRLGAVRLTWSSEVSEGFTSLITSSGRNKATGKGFVRLNCDVANMLRADCTELHLRRKVRLKSSLAKWLHDYCSTSSQTVPIQPHLSTLQTLSGSNPDLDPKEFRRNMKAAIVELQECDPPLLGPNTRIVKKSKGVYAYVAWFAVDPGCYL